MAVFWLLASTPLAATIQMRWPTMRERPRGKKAPAAAANLQPAAGENAEETATSPPEPLLASGSSAAAAGDCSVGVDPESGIAFRTNASGHKELAVRMFCQDGAKLTDPVWAVWRDGTTSPVSDLTTDTYVDSMQHRRSRVLQPPLWKCTHRATGAKLEAVIRNSGGVLFCLLQNGQEICQLSVKK